MHPSLTAARALRMLIVAWAGTALLGAAAAAEEPDTVTRVLLAEQLKQERGCVLDQILSWRAFELAGSRTVEGRIACADGRQFDVTRPAPHRRFEIRLCYPTYC